MSSKLCPPRRETGTVFASPRVSYSHGGFPLIQIAAPPLAIPAGPSRPVSLDAQSGANGFAIALSALAVPGLAAKAAPGEPGPAIGGRQLAAATGKDLPEVGLDLSSDADESSPESEGEEATDGDDIAFAWFALPAAAPDASPMGLSPMVPKPVVPEGAAIEGALPDAATSDPAAPQASAPNDEAVAPEGGPGGEAGSPDLLTESPRSSRSERAAFTLPRPALASEEPATASRQAAAAEPARPLTTASLLAQAMAPPAAQPTPTPLRRTLAESDQPVVTSVAAPSAASLQQVAATTDTQQAVLDMRRQEWMGKMVETIEAMRDAAPVKETRITLMPDALGRVDISVRQDGDRVHVHFAAETQAARQLLTDAQPRLSELAEQRGVRLGQTSVDSGQSGTNAQSGQRHDAQRTQNPSAPASVRSANDSTDSDERIA